MGGGCESWGRHKCQRFDGERGPMMAAGGPARGAGRCGRHQRSIETGTVQRWGVPVMPGDGTGKAPSGLPARGAGLGDLRLAG